MYSPSDLPPSLARWYKHTYLGRYHQSRTVLASRSSHPGRTFVHSRDGNVLWRSPQALVREPWGSGQGWGSDQSSQVCGLGSPATNDRNDRNDCNDWNDRNGRNGRNGRDDRDNLRTVMLEMTRMIGTTGMIGITGMTLTVMTEWQEPHCQPKQLVWIP